MKKDKIILMVMLIIPIIFVAMISVWHAFGVNIGGGKLWEFIWGMVFVLVLTIGAIILWKSLRGTK